MIKVEKTITTDSIGELNELKQNIIKFFKVDDIYMYCVDAYCYYDGKLEEEQINQEHELLRAKELQKDLLPSFSKEYLLTHSPARIGGKTIEQMADSIINYLKSRLCRHFSISDKDNNITLEFRDAVRYSSDVIFKYELTAGTIKKFLQSRNIEPTEANIDAMIKELKEGDIGFGGTTIVDVSFKTNEYELLKSIANEIF